MEKEFLISVLTKQEIEGEKEELEVMTKASLNLNENGYVISYAEEEEDGSRSVTTLEVENGNQITVNREGIISTHMILRKGTRSLSHHVTPYGAFSMGIEATVIESEMNENGGILRFSYLTDVEMKPLGEIEFDITLNPIG
ncbi:MAG: DUF1934 domain-containing protein [Clostridia bacterium]|nr:DUF1934 domain-containing protein [Clostridia bacterium]